MQKKFFLLQFLFILLFSAGCSAGKDYWQNRLDDACDMVTLTAGGGFGVKIFLFGVQVDSGYNYSPFRGLMGGEFVKSVPHSGCFHINEGNIGIPLPFVNAEIFYPNTNAARRGKTFCGGSMLLPFFLLETKGVKKVFCNTCSWQRKFAKRRAWDAYCRKTPPEQRCRESEFRKKLKINWESAEYGGPQQLKTCGKINWSVYADIHLVCALGWGFRAGINPGEIADFLLGWGMVDIFKDDL